MNLARRLLDTARTHGDRKAVRLDDTVLTYDRLQAEAAGVARWLTSNGLEPGDRVGMILPNVPAHPVHFFGSLLAGGVVVPMNPLLKSGEIEYYLADSGARFLFAAPEGAAEARAGAAATGATVVVVDPYGRIRRRPTQRCSSSGPPTTPR
ncbi:AMP-binding protein [Saccharopolyspora gloriosae]|uniref:AMP-binding protein n=1 Tax=Saccharopolyspora gloriosae TaxID=455344 RepID=UPI00215EA0C7|nr:AMP-binding protein [Saccharopolyspora gloriosae]